MTDAVEKNLDATRTAIEARRARRRARAGARHAAAPARRRGRALRYAGICLLVGWAVGASLYALFARDSVNRLADEQAELKASFETTRRGLMRRLIGVESNKSLEADGLAGRLADIIARQVELENRQSALSMMADRIINAGPAEAGAAAVPGSAPAAAPPARPRNSQAAPEPPTSPMLRLGSPAAAEGSPDPRPVADAPSNAGPSPRRDKGAQAVERLPVREQFDKIDAAMAWLETAQVQLVDTYGRAARTGIAHVQAAIAEVGLKVAPDPAPAAPREPVRAGPRRPPDPFEDGVAKLEVQLIDVGRWKKLAETMPFRAPLDAGAGLTSNFGTRKDPFTGAATMHAGMDFRSPIGTPVHAPAIGRVITAGVTGGYGNLVEIDHGHDVVTRYGHLSAFNVSVGQAVTPATVVGLIGSTGRSTGPHLHYETRIAGSAIDPAKFLHAGADLYATPTRPAASPSDGSPADSADDAADD